MPCTVWLSDAAVNDLDRIRECLTQPGAGVLAAAKLADILESLAELPDTASRYPVEPDRPSHRYVALHGYWIRFRIGREFIFMSRIFGQGRTTIDA
jgi:plasmid stabilization system protein ParE